MAYGAAPRRPRRSLHKHTNCSHPRAHATHALCTVCARPPVRSRGCSPRASACAVRITLGVLGVAAADSVPLVMAQAFFDTSQGFFNALIFVALSGDARGRYVDLLGRWCCCCPCCRCRCCRCCRRGSGDGPLEAGSDGVGDAGRQSWVRKRMGRGTHETSGIESRGSLNDSWAGQ